MSTQPVRRRTAEVANTPSASQPLPTRPQRVASSQHPNISTAARLELIQESCSSIKDADSAKKWLVEKELIIDGEDTTAACLTMALLYLACGKFSLDQLINGIRAVAICLESISAPPPVTTDSSTIADRIIKSLQERLNTIEQKVEECTTKVLATPIQSDGFPPLGSAHGPTSYAAALASNAPPPNRAHHEVLLRSEIQTRQVLLDGPKDGRGAANNLTEKELVTKAKLAIELMAKDALTLRPLSCKVITATILRNKGVILEFSSAEGAEWIRNPENAHLFEDNFGGSVSIKPRSYPITVEFLPTSLADTLTDSIREIEDTNSLTHGTITNVRWMKQPKNWRIGQRAAHAIFNLKQAEDANNILKNGIIIEGTRLRARKVEDDPQRCFKCQHYGHAAAKCNNNFDTCATCMGSHPSAECTESRRDKFNCAPCRTNNLPGKHAAWDSSCPVRIEEKKKLLTKRPENSYRYFVTNEAWTWTANNSPDDANAGPARWHGTTNDNRQQERPTQCGFQNARDNGWHGPLGNAPPTNPTDPRPPPTSQRRPSNGQLQPSSSQSNCATTEVTPNPSNTATPPATQSNMSTPRPTPGRPRSQTIGASTQRTRSTSRRRDSERETGQLDISSFFSNLNNESRPTEDWTE